LIFISYRAGLPQAAPPAFLRDFISAACYSPRPSRLLLASKENVNLFTDCQRAFKIGEMPAVFQRDHAGIWKCLSNVFSRSGNWLTRSFGAGYPDFGNVMAQLEKRVR
jgi:hypothetical protein